MALFQVLGYHGPCVCLTVQILISVPVYMSSLGGHAASEPGHTGCTQMCAQRSCAICLRSRS